MAPLTFKSRPKMHSWSPPLPPKPKRSRFYVWAVLGWFGATAVSYLWLSGNRDEANSAVTPPNPVDGALVPPALEVSMQRVDARVAVPTPQPPSAMQRASESERPSPTNDGEVRACEEFIEQANQAPDNRLPTYLGRSAIDQFIGENDWARPCRAAKRRPLALCVAIRDGAVVGLTARSSPPNLTLENCLREQAKKLALQPESAVRVIRSTLYL